MLTIVVADDEPDIRLMLRLLLRRDGVEVELACDGREALDAVRRLSPPLAILDHRMPHHDGLSVVRTLQQEGFPGRLVLFSAHLDEAMAASAVALGVEAVPKASLHRLTEIVAEVRAGLHAESA